MHNSSNSISQKKLLTIPAKNSCSSDHQSKNSKSFKLASKALWFEKIYYKYKERFDKIENQVQYQYLPQGCTIDDINIQTLNWFDFKGSPDKDTWFQAHTYWNINYQFSIRNSFSIPNQPLMKYKLNISVQPMFNKQKSWTKSKSQALLQHEIGHYLIGCLCALNFKRKIENKLFNHNYQYEIQEIFNNTLTIFLDIERLYDEETHHHRKEEDQLFWNYLITQELRKYQTYYTN